MVLEEKSIVFCIATHSIEVVMPTTFDWERVLHSFKPFECNAAERKKAICSIRIVEEPFAIEQDSLCVLHEESGILGYWYALMEKGQNFIVDVQFVENGNHYRMVSDKRFSAATIYIGRNDKYTDMILSSLMAIVYTQSAVFHQTLLIHASAVEKNGQGYAFLGKSGTGKSTHSALWLRHIEGVELLNDDNPALHIEEDGSVYLYGTPWSGKTPCYKNRSVRLEALIRLEQAVENRLTWKKGVNALITLLPSCSSMRWSELLYAQMCNLAAEVSGKVKIGHLQCLPDKNAALLCYNEIKKCKFAAK